VVRGAERPAAPAGPGGGAGERAHRGRLERLVVGHRRQQPGQPLREHRLAAARRAGQQQPVAAGRGDLQGPARARLAADVGEVGTGRKPRAVFGPPGGPDRIDARERPARGDRRPDLAQRRGRARPLERGRRGFGGARCREHQSPARCLAPDREREHQRAAHRPQRPGQRQLAHQFVAVEHVRRRAGRRREDADRNRQVEAPGPLGQIGRREVHGDPARREVEAAVQQRGADPLAALADLGVGQPHDVERRQPVGQVDLDRDRRRIDADQAAAVDDGERHGPSPKDPNAITM
jgi:hypothetical protein